MPNTKAKIKEDKKVKSVKSKRKISDKITIGWRELVEIKINQKIQILAKVDTGAEYSALHATDISIKKRGGEYYAIFRVNPKIEKQHMIVKRFVKVRSSNGETQLRPLINASAVIAGRKVKLDMTLTDRTPMNYDMLLGRKALVGKFVVDCDKKESK